MFLNIISLKGIQFEGDILSLNLRTHSGEVTILDRHRPIITELSPGLAKVVKNDGQELRFEIKSGFLEVNDKNSASLLIN